MYNLTTMSTGTDLIKTTFNELQAFGIDWIASIILIFLTMLIISRQTQVWQYLALSVTMAWGAAGLKIPNMWYAIVVIMFSIQLLTSRIIQEPIKAMVNRFKMHDSKIADIGTTFSAGRSKSLPFTKSIKEKQQLVQAKDDYRLFNKKGSNNVLSQALGSKKAFEILGNRKGEQLATQQIETQEQKNIQKSIKQAEKLQARRIKSENKILNRIEKRKIAEKTLFNEAIKERKKELQFKQNQKQALFQEALYGAAANIEAKKDKKDKYFRDYEKY